MVKYLLSKSILCPISFVFLISLSSFSHYLLLACLETALEIRKSAHQAVGDQIKTKEEKHQLRVKKVIKNIFKFDDMAATAIVFNFRRQEEKGEGLNRTAEI